ncbi:zinc finger protein 570-like isoform X2 [Anthonomus grandis grandis]|uniref:zinc finger protein 570-like isoform X2 n=1 Tax=Anthonomus grandis grandis TaxID=2921223 RepID=UPI002166BC25|nr:zinc finger protein 570-like isoform X2 [Anthonomus grandis grandis]
MQPYLNPLELLRKNPSDSTTCLILPDINSSTMSTILDYIYTGTTVINSNAFDEFLSVAKFLQIDINSTRNFFPEKVKKYEDECLMDYRKELKKEETAKKQKLLPDLLPLDVSSIRKSPKRTCNAGVVPSPWCQRDGSFLSDPRLVQLGCLEEETQKPYQEDTNNNNIQLTHNREELKPENKLDSTIQNFHLQPADPALSHLERPELPRFTNFPFSRQLKDLLPESRSWTSLYSSPLYYNNPLPLSQKSVETTTTTAVEPPSESSMSSESANEDRKDIKQVKKKSFKCEDCDKSFSQLRNYKYHRSVHEGTKVFSAECPECGKTFNDRGYLSSHMKIHRDRKEYACPNCPKRFNQRVAYNMHLRIHTGLKPHECPTCKKTFSRKMLLKQHQRVHTGERPYSCPECGKSFADRSNMSLHARLHTGVKPYACTLCPKSFTKKHHLKTHMNFHTGLKPYKCDNCGLAFSQSSNMRTHFKKCILKGEKGGNLSSNETNSS